MLERVALHQSRFRTPGVGQDARGVLLGQRGLVLFASLDRLVAFLRGYAESGSLDELVPSVAIQQVTTPLRTREIVLSFAAESSYRMDRVAEVARLAGGLTFTGTQRHFVQYRDDAAPLGYDVTDLLDTDAAIALHHSDFHQAYDVVADMSLRGLLVRLRPRRLPKSAEPEPGDVVLASVASGLAPSVVSYLVRNGLTARVGLVTWASSSAFTDAGHTAHLFAIETPPPRLLDLLRAVPGIAVYRQLAPGVAVELGHAHPVALDSCASLFDDGGLVLFDGDAPPREIRTRPTLVSVEALLGTRDVEIEATDAPRGAGEEAPLEPAGELLPLRLAPGPEAPGRVTAAVVPRRQRPWLARVLYALPPRALEGLRMALSPERIFLYDPAGIEGIPLGRAYAEPALRIHVPVGLALTPALAPDVLAELVPEHRQGHVFFEPGGGPPRFVALDAFGPVGRVAIAEVAGQAVPAHPPSNADVPLSLLHYEPTQSFPLWGAVGRDRAPDDGPPDEDDGPPSPPDDGPGRALITAEPAEETG